MQKEAILHKKSVLRKIIKSGLSVALALLAVVWSGCGKVVDTAGDSRMSYSVMEVSGYDLQGTDEELSDSTSEIADDALKGMEESPVLEYLLPVQLPNILVDLEGYCIGEKKLALVRGSKLPAEFTLVDGETGKTIFRGLLENITYHEEVNLYTAYADFSEIEKSGEFYLHCDIIGYSEKFSIRENLYEELFSETCEELLLACEQGELTVSQAIILLQTYEWYPEFFEVSEAVNSDALEAGSEAVNSDALEAGSQTVNSDALEAESEAVNSDTLEAGSQATIRFPDIRKSLGEWDARVDEKNDAVENPSLYTAFLAKYSRICAEYNETLAAECLERAKELGQDILETKEIDGDAYWALVELYRATGSDVYHRKLKANARIPENVSDSWEDMSYLYGSMTYAATLRKVDVSLCEACLNFVMAKSEQIYDEHEAELYTLQGQVNSTEILNHALELACGNYVMNNYPYTDTLKEYLHYLMGRNSDAENDYAESREESIYLLLLAQLAQSEKLN